MFKFIGKSLIALLFGWVGSASAVPITDTVTVIGREWAQIDLFMGVQDWYVDAVCPAGICVDTQLKGYDMLGWIWASDDEVTALFNSYIGGNRLGPAPDTYTEIDSVWAPAFFADGWRATSSSIFVKEARGSTRTSWPYGGFIDDFIQGRADSASINDSFLLPETYGKWFYREAASVPTPHTYLLLSFGLVVLGYSRRKRITS